MERSKRKYFESGALLFLILVLIGLLLLLTFRKEKNPPVISYETESVNLTNAEIDEIYAGHYDCLLAGVTAYDEVDGDVTDHLFVNDVRFLKDALYAVVTYKVADSAGNIGTAKRIAFLRNRNNLQRLLSTYLKAARMESETEEQEVLDEVPHLKMVEKATIVKGSVFDPRYYIEELYDNKDTIADLIANAVVIGKVDSDKIGEYRMIFYVVDSDNNISEPSEMLITVID